MEQQVTEKGLDGEVTLTVTHITIKHFWQSKNGRGTATYPLSSVTGVEFRPGALQGRFTLIVAGGVQRSDKKGDPLTVLVGKKNNPRFERLRDLVLQAIDAHRTAEAGVRAVGAPVGVVEQLARLAGLHGQGALSDAEFAAAKARLLGQAQPGTQDQAGGGRGW